MKTKNKFFAILGIFTFPAFILTAGPLLNLFENLPLMRCVTGERKGGPNSEIYGITLDSPIYEKCSPDFSDIRILGVDVELPYIMEKEIIHISGAVKKNCLSKLLSLKKLNDNKYEITVELTDEKLIPSEAALKTPSRNYEKNVSAFGSNDLKNWEKLSENSNIFDYSQIVDLRNNAIPLSARKFRYYKFAIDNFTETKTRAIRELITENRQGQDYSKIEKVVKKDDTFRIDDISLRASVPVDEDKRIDYPLKSFSKEKGKDNNDDIITIETFRQPLTKIKILADSVNFFRNLELQGGDDGKSWSHICNGTITKIDMSSFKKEEMEIPFQERRFRYYRITVRNGDSPALNIKGAAISGNVYTAKFIMTQKKTDRLAVYYGGKNIPPPVYDIAMVLSKFQDAQVKKLSMANPEPNPFFKPEVKKSEKRYWKYLFAGAIVIMVAVLGWALFRGMKKIESMPD